MNILMANWAWYPTGGDWTYINSINQIYEKNGHHIIPFSMQHSKNIHTQYDTFFTENLIQYKNPKSLKSYISAFTNINKPIYSFEAKRNLNKLLTSTKIDIVQLNSILGSLSPSIIPILAKHNIPITWRILDYKLICPSTHLYKNDNVCKLCKDGKYYHCIKNKCKDHSLLLSIMTSLTNYCHDMFAFDKYIDTYLFQSQFTRNLFIEFGYDIKKTAIIENPLECTHINPNYHFKDYILYFGRIEKEKGIYTLLNAMKQIPRVNLKIVGNGNEYENSIQFAQKNNLKNVDFIGPKWNSDLIPILKNCKTVIVPSEWHEPSPYVVLQSFAYGKPVIASNMGGLNDLVKNNINGLVFENRNAKDLALKISQIYDDKSKIIELGRKARQHVEKLHNPKRYYDFTFNLFNTLINSKN